VLTALDSLPEDVGLEGAGTPPKTSGCSDERSGQLTASTGQQEHEQAQQQQQEPKHKGRFGHCTLPSAFIALAVQSLQVLVSSPIVHVQIAGSGASSGTWRSRLRRFWR
jgi:hypothetical protein